MSKAVDKGVGFTFSESECVIKDINLRLIAVATKVGSLYRVVCTKPKDCVYSVAKKSDSSSKEDLWHPQYGHLGVKSLQQLARGDLVEGLNYNASNEISFCEPCLKGKHQESISTIQRKKAVKAH